jgi:hypothetical protein
MHLRRWRAVAPLGLSMFFAAAAGACGSKDDDAAKNSAACLSTREFFALKVWPTMSANCTGCHAPGGIATTGEHPKRTVAKFELQWESSPGFLDRNLASLKSMVREYRAAKLLLKPTGNDHVGGKLIQVGSPEYAAFEELNARLLADDDGCAGAGEATLPKLELLDWKGTFRKAVIDLGGRLPSGSELAIADEAAFDAALDALMKAPTFATRVKEMWNDVLLLKGAQEVGAFSFDKKNFSRAEEWQTAYDKCAGAADVGKCRAEIGDYWEPVSVDLRREPLELIAHVVRKDAPFSEVLTAPYALVNFNTSKIYDLASAFTGVTDREDWRELQVKQTDGSAVPHAGVLSTPGFLGRWVSTRTNINRARARVVFKAFLATSVLDLAQRPVDSSALTAVKDPTKNASACAVCHVALDPVANSFSNFPDDRRFSYNASVTAATDPHVGTFAAGFGAEATPGTENKLLPWMTARLVKDERFAYAVVKTFYTGLIGVPPMSYPRDGANDPTFTERLHAWSAQDAFLRKTAKDFAAGGMNAKQVVRTVVKSPYFRAIKGAGSDALLADLGPGRLLTPEMLDRKLRAVMGTHWGDWTTSLEPYPYLTRQYDSFNILYGGIDSFSVVDRATHLNAVMAGVVERMSNQMACRTVAWDFTKPKAERLLFPEVDVTSLPTSDEAAIRRNLVALYARLLGEAVEPNGEEVNAAYKLFTDTHVELSKTAKPDALPWGCRGRWDRSKPVIRSCGTAGMPDYKPTCYASDADLPEAQRIDQDKTYTIGSWMAVVSYLLSDYRFTHQ